MTANIRNWSQLQCVFETMNAGCWRDTEEKCVTRTYRKFKKLSRSPRSLTKLRFDSYKISVLFIYIWILFLFLRIKKSQSRTIRIPSRTRHLTFWKSNKTDFFFKSQLVVKSTKKNFISVSCKSKIHKLNFSLLYSQFLFLCLFREQI